MVTNGADDAGFDGTVYLTMNGSDGSSAEVKLDAAVLMPGSAPDYKPFGKASSDAFVVNMADVGQLGYVHVRIEATGSLTSW